MALWLLSFTQLEVAVSVEAETLAHARLLAAANQVCRELLFDDGFAIKPSFQYESRLISSGARSRKMKRPTGDRMNSALPLGGRLPSRLGNLKADDLSAPPGHPHLLHRCFANPVATNCFSISFGKPCAIVSASSQPFRLR